MRAFDDGKKVNPFTIKGSPIPYEKYLESL